MYSWALLVLGLGAHLLVSKEAWDHLADRYFDYMKVDRRYQHARDAFTDAMAEVEDNARAAMEEALAELDHGRGRQRAGGGRDALRQRPGPSAP